jgi:hypothetical protein
MIIKGDECPKITDTTFSKDMLKKYPQWESLNDKEMNEGTKLANLNHAHCDKCANDNKDYCEAFDAFFCITCDLWIERGCNDPQCRCGCNQRPARPSEVK